MLSGVAALAAPAAFAQDTTAEDAPQQEAQAQTSEDVITVTGSRIQRTDTVAPSPVTTVSEEILEVNNVVNTEDMLNSLPQIVPAFDATSNNPGNGTATVSLRGLGTTRTLVLVDGQRFVGSGAALVVDLNNIPAALIETIDVTTGGASAIYGSDAVAGVVNFILRDDFEGVELSTSHEFSTDNNDAKITDVSATMGGNFADGRGNAVLSLGYTNREALFQGDRDFSREAFFDPGPGNAAQGFIPGGSSNIPSTLIQGATGAFAVTTDQDGGVVEDFPLYNYAPTNYLQLPQERHSVSGFATYEVNDYVELYARGIFANNIVDSQLAPTPTGALPVTINLDNPLLSAELRDLIASDPASNNGDGTADIIVARRMQELGTRNALRDTNSFQGVFGARGDLSEDWSYDVSANYSRSSVSQIQSGNISVSAFQEALLCDGGPTAVASGCDAPALDIFNGENSVSEAAADYINRTGAQIDTIEQVQVIASMSGVVDALTSPMADVAPGVAFGTEYRSAEADIRPDSVLGPDVRGFNQSLPIQGGFDVYELFGELDYPLITDQPFIESLNFTGAYRFSDYSTVGETHTYAAGLGWEPIPDLRFRGQYNRAVRAPNVSDLFAPATNGFPGAQDPCAGGTQGGFGPDTIVENCIATGVPAGQVGQPFQLNGQIETLFAGNPDVQEEVADTYTFGFVYQPAFFEGFTAQVDYYDIQIDDAIATPTLQVRLDECYRQDIQESCAIFAGARDPNTGAISNPFFPTLRNSNLATLKAEGVDVRLDYAFDADRLGLSPEVGSFSVNYYSTFTLNSGSQTSEAAGFISCEGEYGLECGEPTPEYKHLMQANWYWNDLTTSVRWRYVGAVDADDATLPEVSDLSDNIDGTSYFDITLGYDVTDNASLQVGLQNAFDEEPPILGSTASEQANTWPATYDPFGRRLFLGAKLRF